MVFIVFAPFIIFNCDSMKILFSGGGTLGPVTPLLAIHDMIAAEYLEAEFLWYGTAAGPERALVASYHIRFQTLPTAKWRRYLSFLNILDIFRLIHSFFKSLRLLWYENPSICISAGGYVSVPVHAAAWFLGIPTWIHQQDVIVGFANKLMVPFARAITTALKKNVTDFPAKKVQWVGNPVRNDIFQGSRQRAYARFGLEPSLPVVFALGGGTGSVRVNQLIQEAVSHLQGTAQILHLTGKERPNDFVANAERLFLHYHSYQFFTDEMADAYAVADVIVARGGFGTLAEIAALAKPAIIIPKSGHQEENVAYLSAQKAILVLDEATTNGYHVAATIKELLRTEEVRTELGQRLEQVLPQAKKQTILGLFAQLLG